MIIVAVRELIKGAVVPEIYFLRAPKNAKAPFIILQETTGSRNHVLTGPAGMGIATVQVDVYDKVMQDASDLAAVIEQIVDGYAGEVTLGDNKMLHICEARFENSADLLDETDQPPLYRAMREYNIAYYY